MFFMDNKGFCQGHGIPAVDSVLAKRHVYFFNIGPEVSENLNCSAHGGYRVRMYIIKEK